MQGEPAHDAGRPPLRRRRRRGARRPRRAGPRPPPRPGVPEVWIDPGIGFGKTARAQPRAARPPRRLRRHRLPGARRHEPQGVPRAPARRLRRHRRARARSTTGSRARSPPPPGRWPTERGWSGCTTCAPPRRPPSSSAARSRRKQHEETDRRAGEGQVGTGHPAAELRVDPQGSAGGVRAAGRLRRQPPPGAPPGGDHLDPRAGLHLRRHPDPVAAQPPQLRRARRAVAPRAVRPARGADHASLQTAVPRAGRHARGARRQGARAPGRAVRPGRRA